VGRLGPLNGIPSAGISITSTTPNFKREGQIEGAAPKIRLTLSSRLASEITSLVDVCEEWHPYLPTALEKPSRFPQTHSLEDELFGLDFL